MSQVQITITKLAFSKVRAPVASIGIELKSGGETRSKNLETGAKDEAKAIQLDQTVEIEDFSGQEVTAVFNIGDESAEIKLAADSAGVDKWLNISNKAGKIKVKIQRSAIAQAKPVAPEPAAPVKQAPVEERLLELSNQQVTQLRKDARAARKAKNTEQESSIKNQSAGILKAQIDNIVALLRIDSIDTQTRKQLIALLITKTKSVSSKESQCEWAQQIVEEVTQILGKNEDLSPETKRLADAKQVILMDQSDAANPVKPFDGANQSSSASSWAYFAIIVAAVGVAGAAYAKNQNLIQPFLKKFK